MEDDSKEAIIITLLQSELFEIVEVMDNVFDNPLSLFYLKNSFNKYFLYPFRKEGVQWLIRTENYGTGKSNMKLVEFTKILEDDQLDINIKSKLLFYLNILK